MCNETASNLLWLSCEGVSTGREEVELPSISEVPPTVLSLNMYI